MLQANQAFYAQGVERPRTDGDAVPITHHTGHLNPMPK